MENLINDYLDVTLSDSETNTDSDNETENDESKE